LKILETGINVLALILPTYKIRAKIFVQVWKEYFERSFNGKRSLPVPVH